MNHQVSPLALAIIGAGRMGILYGQIANELSLTKLVALTSEHEDTTAQAAQQLGVPGYANCRYEEMLDRHPEIEAVVVATPEWQHVDPVLTCLRLKKHVLVEKPLTVSSDDAWSLVAAGEQAGKVFSVCHSQRFNPRFALMREAVASGEIGRIQHLYARRNSLQPAVNRVRGHFPLPYWLAPHDLDVMLWTTGSAAVSVHAVSKGKDFILASIHFTCGAVGVLETSWCTPGFAGRPLNEVFTVRGDAGMVEVVGHEQGLAVYNGTNWVKYPDTYHAPIIQGHTEGYYRALLRHFAGAARNLWPPVVSAREAAAVIDLASALQQSLETGTEVKVIRR
jgi:predicted dehydrogenase